MVATYIKKITHSMNCLTGVCSREIIYIFLIGQVFWLVENNNIVIFSDTMNVINVTLCMVVLHIELCLFITLSVALSVHYAFSCLDIISRSQ